MIVLKGVGGCLFKQSDKIGFIVGMLTGHFGGNYPGKRNTVVVRRLINGGERIATSCTGGNPIFGVEDQMGNFGAGPCSVKRTIVEAREFPVSVGKGIHTLCQDIMVCQRPGNSVTFQRSEEHTSELQSRGHIV